MEQMDRMYRNDAERYDCLVAREDWQGLVKKQLRTLVDWQGREVIEFGVGTGRVTSWYIDLVSKVRAFDNSAAMLERARMRLDNASASISLEILDNSRLPEAGLPADIVVEGWSFGHEVVREAEGREERAKALIEGSLALARQAVIIIESLGTGLEEPAPPGPGLALFYQLLGEAGFTRHVISSDYRFESVDEAAEVLGSFFGQDLARQVRAKYQHSTGSCIVPEWTGIWVKQRP